MILGTTLGGCQFPKEEPQLPRGEAIGELPEGALMMFIDNEHGVYCYSYLASISCVRMWE
ncbi:hypothetical protein HOR13_gp51 [Xanthomonas phage XAJ24]|uniref:Uncharacterized protein n=1 Tax=Xanthomonas phage XAJ24 TaxID=1775250 RepID=A0A1I9L282_9CAUD|nr:hypothetical protein HOR13_gp51 [Xanthomonas phage XAJ24]AMW36069.1 hypothetical protein [Xanthomonas phage XAJ24]